jgi:hypothetical protein
MKKLLLAVVALACLGGVATAGPNANGVLNAFLCPTCVYTLDWQPYEYCLPICCEDGINHTTGPNTAVIVITANFCPGSRLAGITFGISYTAGVGILDGAPCGEFELPTADWPASGSGNAVTFNPTRTDPCVPVYWLAAYSYYSNPDMLQLIGHPSQGAKFGDDSVPSILDDIACLGAFGFDQSGITCCPDCGVPTGACCTDPDGDDYKDRCDIKTQADCTGDYLGDGTVCSPNPCPQPPLGACCTDPDGDGYADHCDLTTAADCTGDYLGDGTVCNPNPCPQPPTPTVERTWGQIKANYR